MSAVHGGRRACVEDDHRVPLERMEATRSAAVAGNLVAGAPLLYSFLPELGRPDLAGVAPLTGKRRWRWFGFGRSRRLYRPEKSPEIESNSGLQKSAIAPGALTRELQCQIWKFPKMEIS